MSCTNTVQYCVTKGTNFSADVSFTTAWSELIEDPSDYYGEMVFREAQDDDAVDYLQLTAIPDTTDPEAPVQLHFTASPVETTALPDWDIVGYCDLVSNDGTSRQRLFNMEVSVNE